MPNKSALVQDVLTSVEQQQQQIQELRTELALCRQKLIERGDELLALHALLADMRNDINVQSEVPYVLQ